MGDSYVEQLIKRKTSLGNMAVRVGAIVSGLLITYILMVLIGIIALVGAFAIGYGIFYLYRMTDVEYEYLLVNGEFKVDAIYGKAKRKNLGTFDIKKSEVITKADSQTALSYERNDRLKIFDYTTGEEETKENVYLMVVPYGAANAKVYIEPNEELIEAMRMQAPGKMRN